MVYFVFVNFMVGVIVCGKFFGDMDSYWFEVEVYGELGVGVFLLVVLINIEGCIDFKFDNGVVVSKFENLMVLVC